MQEIVSSSTQTALSRPYLVLDTACSKSHAGELCRIDVFFSIFLLFIKDIPFAMSSGSRQYSQFQPEA